MTRTTRDWQNILDKTPPYVAKESTVERVREALSWIEGAENRAHAEWIRTADTHHRDVALAYTQAVTWIRYALGDTDD